MGISRRHFLALASLVGLSFGGASQIRRSQSTNSDNSNSAALANSPNPVEKALLLRFVSVADTGTGDSGQYAVAKAMTQYHQQNPFDLAILAGDNIYTNGEIEKIGEVFEQPYKALLQQGVKFQACLGNHDIRTANGDLQVSYAGFNMDGRYYTFKRGPVQFFALDTNDVAGWDTQLAWLETELSRSDAPWKIVFGHHQVYSSGIYGVNQPFIKTLTPLFQKYQVQLYINGHDHHYERSRSINGTTYLICGAGSETRPVGRSAWTAYSVAKRSFAALEVYENEIIIRGIGTDNHIFDQGAVNLKSV